MAELQNKLAEKTLAPSIEKKNHGRGRRNPNKYNKNKQMNKQLRRLKDGVKAGYQKNEESNKKVNKNSSISDIYHKINYIKQMSTLMTELSEANSNEDLKIFSNTYNQSLEKYILKNKSSVNLSKDLKKFYCKKCFTNKKYNTLQKLLNVHDLSEITNDSNRKSFLIQKTCKTCQKRQNLYIGQNEEYISFEGSNVS